MTCKMKQMITFAGALLFGGAFAFAAPRASAADLTVTMQKTTLQRPGEVVGRITISASDAGAVFKLDLRGLPPGSHGFHVYQNPSCDPVLMNGMRIPAGPAGGAWDPDNTFKHAGPMGEGYRGDLPVLEVANDGTASQTLAAPRIKDITALRGHTLIIHIGGDNYSDDPAPMGGGGGRMACGIIPGKTESEPSRKPDGGTIHG